MTIFPRFDAPDYVLKVMEELQTESLTRLSDAQNPSKSPVVISVIKNELDRLPEFLTHYRSLGITRFCIIDNDSTDGSREFLLEQDDVEVLFTDRPFFWQRKHAWITIAMMMIGRGSKSWFVVVDADEHIVYEAAPNRKIEDVIATLERRGISRIRGCLIDMYDDGPLLKDTDRSKTLRERYPYFDSTGYVEAKYKEIMSRKGGPRQRVFGGEAPNFRPEMSKYPIFKLGKYDVFANPHHIWPYHGNFDTPCYLGILHYKFLPGLMGRISKAVADGSYWDDSLEYRCYLSALKKDPELSLMAPVSKKYASPASLIEADLISKLP